MAGKLVTFEDIVKAQVDAELSKRTREDGGGGSGDNFLRTLGITPKVMENLIGSVLVPALQKNLGAGGVEARPRPVRVGEGEAIDAEFRSINKEKTTAGDGDTTADMFDQIILGLDNLIKVCGDVKLSEAREWLIANRGLVAPILAAQVKK